MQQKSRKIQGREATHPRSLYVRANKQAKKMTTDQQLAKLIAGCLRMDEASQMGLYQHFYSYGMGICLRYARTRESALEMLNDGFLKVFQKIDQYNMDMQFKPWLRKILVNAAIDYYRRYEQKRETLSPTGAIPPATYNEALDQLEFEDLLNIMQQLPPAYRMVFNLYVVEGLSHADIAAQLGISVGSSKSNLSKARQKIKTLLRHTLGIHLKT